MTGGSGFGDHRFLYRFFRSFASQTTRITVEIPESVRTALKATCLKEHKTQSELATEALIRFLTAPIGSYTVHK